MKARVSCKGEACDSIELSFSFRCLASYLTTFDSDIVFENIELALDIDTALRHLENVVLMLHTQLLEGRLVLHVELVLALSNLFD